jgi:hypothetical protein
MLVVFPIFIRLAMIRSLAARTAILTASTALLLYFTGRYVNGWWAF